MTVYFDNATGTWRIVAGDGRVIMDGFATNTAAWAWIDTHSAADQGLAAAADRIRDAFSTR